MHGIADTGEQDVIQGINTGLYTPDPWSRPTRVSMNTQMMDELQVHVPFLGLLAVVRQSSPKRCPSTVTVTALSMLDVVRGAMRWLKC